ncbi:Ribonuclease H1 [Sparassis crispa]|uniref:ribonuclease H n=1 Tax=Sparassis crispa TaxID=139825 RepID=A0A401GJN9_9APHY|nr:Ribonuclease H1 [Sparassis crispa]GBE82387.1 Ribonuclease H1 [Sparassis crispa]
MMEQCLQQHYDSASAPAHHEELQDLRIQHEQFVDNAQAQLASLQAENVHFTTTLQHVNTTLTAMDSTIRQLSQYPGPTEPHGEDTRGRGFQRPARRANTSPPPTDRPPKRRRNEYNRYYDRRDRDHSPPPQMPMASTPSAGAMLLAMPPRSAAPVIAPSLPALSVAPVPPLPVPPPQVQLPLPVPPTMPVPLPLPIQMDTRRIMRLGPIAWDLSQARAQLLAIVHASGSPSSFPTSDIIETRPDDDHQYLCIVFRSSVAADAFVDAWRRNCPAQYNFVVPHLLPRGHCTIRLLSWNVNGRLALKLTDSMFVSYLFQYDVLLLQETHLRPEEHDVLIFPEEYDMIAVSRRNTPTMQQPGGGVAIFLRCQIPRIVLTSLCTDDMLVVDLNVCILINVYLPPETSPWNLLPPAQPEQRLKETLAVLGRCPDKPIIVAGDLNARIAALSPTNSDHIRQSPDVASLNSRGRRILQLCDDFDLDIVNGTSLQVPSSLHSFTSLQPAGSAIVDYVLASAPLDRIVHSLDILPHRPEWTDHSALRLQLHHPTYSTELPAASNHKLKQHRQYSHIPSSAMGPSPSTALDTILHKTLLAVETPEAALQRLYGPVYIDTPPVSVYTDGSCMRQGTPTAAAGAGVYWGPNNTRNNSIRVPGDQTNNRGELFAILHALMVTSPSRTLRLYTDSTYSIHSLCHWAPQHASLGWSCANADIMRDAVAFLTWRIAPTVFIWIKGHAGNAHADAADALAKHATVLPLHDNDYCSPVLPPPLDTSSYGTTLSMPKVTTNLLPLPCSPPHCNPSPKLPTHVSHRGRTRLRHMMDCNKEKLLHCANDRAFWSLIRQWTNTQPRPAQVTVDQLHDVFRARMNPPEAFPVEFNDVRHVLNHCCANLLPQRTVDTTPQRFFSRAFTIDEIAHAKAHIKLHSLRSARGADRVAYITILAIPNEQLLLLFEQCLAQCDAPQIWLTSLLAAIQKKGKSAADPAGYRTIGLESCLLKLLTLLIDRRLRAWSDAGGIIPPSQNGFRANHRTNNNAFILRTAIETARSKGQTLYVAFVDLTNAFPSVDHATLWVKLQQLGASGPLLDWLRMLLIKSQYADLVGDSNNRTEELGNTARVQK